MSDSQRLPRRSFLKYCAAVAASLGLPASYAAQIAEALTADNRAPVVWLHFAECTGCSEAFLRTENPDVDDLLFNTLNLTYHETIQAACGAQATANLSDAVARYAGQFICVVEGAIPTADNGVYGMVGGKTMLQIAQEVIPYAKHTIAFGTCAAYGGLPAAGVNLTGAKGVKDAIGVSTINITGCPPNPLNLVSCIANYLLLGQMPALRSDGRPTFCHGTTVHAACTTPDGCMQGYGCKGPVAYNNCPTLLHNGESYCLKAGHQCIGCSEPGFWDAHAPFYNPMWANMFATYRKDAVAHKTLDAASCTPCHGSSMFSQQQSARGEKGFQSSMHSRHSMNLTTNSGCGNCHTAAPGTNKNPIRD